MSSDPIELASALQSASLNRAPSPAHDINPSTAASEKVPATLRPVAVDDDDHHHHHHDGRRRSPPPSPTFSAVPRPRRVALPPLPDLRFEQSYLKSIDGAAGSWTAVAWITARDQVLLPLLQGTLWTLALAGWRRWNRGAGFVGTGVGARVRRWWWAVNGWDVPGNKGAGDPAGGGLLRR